MESVRINAYRAVKAAKEACAISISGIIVSDENHQSPCTIKIDASIENTSIVILEARD